VAFRLSPTPVPDEAAVAVALALATVPGEIAVAVTLALEQAARETVSVPAPLGTHGATAPAAKGEPGSAWKLLGRQEGLFRRTSLTRDITPKGE
jgi:hypothetical protein